LQPGQSYCPTATTTGTAGIGSIGVLGGLGRFLGGILSGFTGGQPAPAGSRPVNTRVQTAGIGGVSPAVLLIAGVILIFVLVKK
jgi:hypothetical protein